MRRLILAASLMALISATCWLWAYRFERVPGVSAWGLAELKVAAPEIPGLEWKQTNGIPILKVSVDAEHPQVGAGLALPGAVPTGYLHLRFRLNADNLRAGTQDWEDGRLMVDWHQVSTSGNTDTDPVGTVRDEIHGELQDVVVDSDHPPAIPSLRVEHLGRSGSFEIMDLRVEAVRERWIWQIGKWFLLAGWGLWGFVFIRSWPGMGIVRPALAACVWMFMGTQSVIPGPWKVQRPIYPAFQLGPETSGSFPTRTESVSTPVDVVPRSGELKPLGKLPVQGSLALKLKLSIRKARPLLHMMMLFAPMFLMALLAGNRPAAGLAVIISLAIELAQVAFGYGFGWDDVGDLACDGTGIAVAVWAAIKMRVYLGKRFPKWMVSPAPLRHPG